MASASSLILHDLQATRYRQPTVSGNANTKFLYNALIVVDAKLPGSAPSARFRGLGEANFRTIHTGDRIDRSWRLIEGALPLLRGEEIPLSSPLAAKAKISSLMELVAGLIDVTSVNRLDGTIEDNVKSLARRVLRPGGNDGRSHHSGGTLLGIETALLDVTAQALGMSVAQLLADGHEAAKDVPTQKLNYVGQVLPEHLDKTIKRLVTGSKGNLLWLDFGARLTPETAESAFQTLTEALSSGEGPEQTVLYRPVRRKHELTYTKLFGQAQRFNADSAHSNISVVPGMTTFSPVEAFDRFRPASASFHTVRPGQLGSLLGVVDNADLNDGKLTFVVAEVQAGPVAIAALANLAAALPRAVLVCQEAQDSRYRIADFGLGLKPDWSMVLASDNILHANTSEAVMEAVQPNEYVEVPYLQPLGPNGTKGHLMEREALALGLDTVRYSKGAFTATDGKHDPLVFKWSRSPLSSAVSLAICTHKEATRMRLGQAGIPVPRGRTFPNGDFDTAREFAEAIGFPAVVKPAMGVRGIGVVAGIQNQKELDLAFEQLQDSKLGAQDFIVEKHVHGKDYRIVVVGDQVIAAILREPASVTGDGQHTIAELVLAKNAKRRLNPHLWGRPIMIDAASHFQLEKAGVTLDTVLDKNQVVLLSNSSSLSQGGDSIDVLDELHPTIREACVAAVKAIPDLAFCGVDFLLEDHTKALDEQEAGICELNAHAAIGNCEYPLYGKPRQVAQTFMRECVDAYDFDVPDERAEKVYLKLTIRGKVSGVGYERWFKRLADEYGLAGWIRTEGAIPKAKRVARRIAPALLPGRGPRQLEAVLVGDTIPATALVAAAVLGPHRSNPTSVSTQQIEPIEVTGFSIVTEDPQEVVNVRDQ